MTTDLVALRAVDVADVAVRARWDDSAELSDDEFLARLRDEESVPWGNNPRIRLIVEDRSSRDVIGGVIVTRSAGRTGTLVSTGEWSDRERVIGDVVSCVTAWAVDEVGLLAIRMDVLADDGPLIAAATAANMTAAVVRPCWIRRGTERIDLLTFERTNQAWGVRS